MWFLVQLIAAWVFLFIVFRWILIGGKSRESPSTGDDDGNSSIYDQSSYFAEAPDALRPEIESDEFDPTEYF